MRWGRYKMAFLHFHGKFRNRKGFKNCLKVLIIESKKQAGVTYIVHTPEMGQEKVCMELLCACASLIK